MSAEIRRSSRSVVHKMALRHMKQVGRVVHPIWTVCLNEIIWLVTGAERRRDDQKCENFTHNALKSWC